MDVISFIKKNRIALSLCTKLNNQRIMFISKRHLNQEIKRKKHHNNIRVVFLSQMVSTWNKMKPTYLRMVNDNCFEPYILCVPENLNSNSTNNSTYLFFKQNGYKKIINAIDKNNKWVSLDKLDIDYLIYDRPYNNYLPTPYKSYNSCKYAKLCLIIYATIMSTNLINSILNPSFMQSVSYYFAETKDIAYYSRKNRVYNKQKTIVCGIPSLESTIIDKNKHSISWSFSKNDFRAIWTPRWSMDKSGGGSNFLNYYKLFLEYEKENQDVDLLIRPHPLMFKTLTNQGYITELELNKYIDDCKKECNIGIDNNGEYISTFWNSNVLISDISSIMVEYFYTGKPIIFCYSDQFKVNYLNTFNKMMSGCYIAHSFSEVIKYLEMLKKGDDPLQSVRRKVIEEHFSLNPLPSEIIVDELKNNSR